MHKECISKRSRSSGGNSFEVARADAAEKLAAKVRLEEVIFGSITIADGSGRVLTARVVSKINCR